MSDASVSLGLLIEPESLHLALSKQINNIIIVDLGTQERFLQGHIPNARLVLPSETQAGPPIPGLAPSDEQLTSLMQKAGLTKHSHVVVYDDEGGGWAGRFIWLLDEIGHTQYSYLNGGIHAWAASGYPLESGMVEHPTSDIKIKNQHQHSILAKDIVCALDTQTLQIWDARSPQEYSGEKINAAKGGHIPGALNYEWTNAMDTERNLRLKPADQILHELAEVGISPEKETITHCQSHHRSGLTYLLGKLLNFRSIKAYPGSWGEWGNLPDTPTEK